MEGFLLGCVGAVRIYIRIDALIVGVIQSTAQVGVAGVAVLFAFPLLNLVVPETVAEFFTSIDD